MQPSIGSEVIPPAAPAGDRERASIVRDELVPSLPRATRDDEIASIAIAPNSVPAPAPGRRPSIVTIPLPATTPNPSIEGGSSPAGFFASRRLMQSGGNTSHRREHQLLKYYLSHM